MVRNNLLAASLHSLGMSDGCSIMEVLCSTEETHMQTQAQFLTKADVAKVRSYPELLTVRQQGQQQGALRPLSKGAQELMDVRGIKKPH